MLLSMTGYGKYEKKASNFNISVEIRSLNSKYFDIISKIDDKIFEYENDIVSIIKDKCVRGKIYLNISLTENNKSNEFIKLNKSKLKVYIEKERQLKKALNISNGLGTEFLVKQPDLFLNSRSLVKQDKKNIMLCINKALEKLLSYRKKEGKIIEKDIFSKIKNINLALRKIIALSDIKVSKELDKIKKKIDKIIPRLDIDKDRLYQEVAIILEKKDINEEISRLEGHLKLLSSFLKTKDARGKKINFLLQEINREVNTIGSKADNLKIRHLVVDVKNDTEKIKEQVQNII